MITWDRERVHKIIREMLNNPDRSGVYPTTECYDQLTELLGEVRTEALGWAWQQACQQHDQGRDPRRTPIPEIIKKAAPDLNPKRE